MIANPTYRDSRRPGHGPHYLLAGLGVVVLLLVLGDVSLIGARLLLERTEGLYDGCIYPNVYVLGVALGGLDPAAAAAALQAAAKPADAAQILLRDGDRQWAVPWAEIGGGLDVQATVQAAFAVGRGEPSLLAELRSLLGRHEVAPVLTVDPQAARGALQRLAAMAAQPPAEATIRLEGEQLVAVAGQPGRALDVEPSLANLTAAVAAPQARNEADLVFQPVAPKVADASPLLAQAEQVLQRQVQLSAYDAVTGEAFSWTVERGAIATWLRASTPEGATAPAIAIDRDAVRASLQNLAAGMGQGRGFRLEEAGEQVAKLLEAGGGSVALYVTHPARTYTVQSGDLLGLIAYRYGIPPALIEEANPGVDFDRLSVSQQLTIPSPDVLLPNLPVPNKRIVISLGEQRMRVYENGAQLWDWPVSTGIADSPTNPGTFQILEKVDNGYASRWDLWMPNFMAIYRAGPDFYNGIHALPILPSGARLWEGLLGKPASFGCVILGVQEAKTLYDWAEIGVTVIVEQ